MDTYTLDTEIVLVERTGTSKSGNPTYRLMTADGVFYTKRDAQVGYSATNYRPAYPMKTRAVTLTFEARGSDVMDLVIDITDRSHL